jgi:FkbM family methyltransferase
MPGLAARTLAIVVRAVPSGLVRYGLGLAAVCPPAFKTMLFERACSRAAALTFSDPRVLMRTNLGLHSGLRCDVPLAKPAYAFGRPQNMIAERSTLTLVVELSRDCRDVLDVGANEGLFTLAVHAASPAPRPRLHWFEPDAEVFARLSRNLAGNGVDAEGHQAAVAELAGEASFFRNLSDDQSGSLTDYFAHKHDTERATVRTLRLADYLEERAISDAIVKVDVEGYGEGVWAGLGREGARVKYLVMEMLEPEIAAGLPARILSESDFRAYYVRDFDLVESPSGAYDYVEPFFNWLFCRLDPAALAARTGAAGFRVIPSRERP